MSRRQFLAMVGAAGAALAGYRMVAKAASGSNITVNEIQPGEDIFEYIGRVKSGFDQTLYRQLLDVLPMMKAESDTAWYEEYTTSVVDALATEASRLHARGVTATSEVLIGEPAPAIAEALRPDEVIVMTSHGAGGIRRWLMGSVAEKLIHRAAAPLVLVPAPGREQVAPAPERPSTLDT